MSKRILVVDDSSMMRKMLAKVLVGKGHHTIVGEAKNGNEALEMYKKLRPDLITMDITMEGMDGLSAAKQILDYDRKALILMLSNLDKEKYSDDVAKIGVIGFVNKHKAQEILDVINAH